MGLRPHHLNDVLVTPCARDALLRLLPRQGELVAPELFRRRDEHPYPAAVGVGERHGLSTKADRRVGYRRNAVVFHPYRQGRSGVNGARHVREQPFKIISARLHLARRRLGSSKRQCGQSGDCYREQGATHQTGHGVTLTRFLQSSQRDSRSPNVGAAAPGDEKPPLAPTTAESSVSANAGPLVSEAGTPLRTGLRILAPCGGFPERSTVGHRFRFVGGSPVAQLRRHRPSPAMAVAVLALFVALGGTSYSAITLSKNSVKSRHIAQGEVKRSDIARGAVNSARVRDFTLVANDFKPGQYPVGPQGPKGDPGAPGATNVRVRKAAGFDEVTAHCEPGERATGGGAHSVNGFIWASAPAANPSVIHTVAPLELQGYTPTSWTAAADGAEPPGTPADVTVWVVCAVP